MKNSSRTFFGVSALLFVPAMLTQSCGKPRYDIKAPQRVATPAPMAQPSTTAQPSPTAQPSQGEPPAPQAPGTEGRDCSAETLLKNEAALSGASGFAKKLPDHRRLKLQDIKSLFDPKLGSVLRSNLVFLDFKVTPRLYSEGYPLTEETVLRDKKNQIVKENFALKMEGFIALSESSQEGNYQFSLLADDGALFEVFHGGAWQVLVDNQGRHSVRLACSQKAIQLNAASLLPFRLHYHQGPKNHLANMLFWKKVDQLDQDVACGKEGQKYFFDPTTQTAKAPFEEFIARGWATVPASQILRRNAQKQEHVCFQFEKASTNQ